MNWKMNKHEDVDLDIENEDDTIGSDIIEPGKYSVSKALEVRHVEELLRITRIKSVEDDAKAIPAFKAGQALFSKKRYKEALRKYVEAALLGHLKSQRRLGVMYLEGLGCRQDYLSALKWLKVAAERNDLHAQEHLAKMYKQGLGIEANPKIAIYWYHRSSELGGVQSTFELATCYEQGHGVPQNSDESIRLYMLAAEQGHAFARYHLGVAYECGLGVDQDTQEAIDWYILAIQGGISDARIRFWKLVDDEEFIPETYEEAIFAEKVGLSLNDPICQLKEALRLMTAFDCSRNFKYFERCFSIDPTTEASGEWEVILWNDYLHIKDGTQTCFSYRLRILIDEIILKSIKANWLLTNFHAIKSDYVGIFYMHLLSGCLGFCESQYWLGTKYYESKEIKKNVKRSVFWFKQAGKQGDQDAYNMLGVMYSREKIGNKFVKKAVKYYKKAVKLGCPIAMYNLANRYKYGTGVKKNNNKYINLLQKSADSGFGSAMYELACELASGEKIEKNVKLSEYWLDKAVEMNQIEAIIEKAGRKEKLLHRRVDENVLYEVVSLYVRAAENGSEEGVFRLIMLQAKGKLSLVSTQEKKRNAKKMFYVFDELKTNREKLLFVREKIKNEMDFYKSLSKTFRKKEVSLEKFTYERLKEWIEKVNNYIAQCKTTEENIVDILQIDREGERRRQRIEEKRSKEQEISNMWYD